MKDAGHRALVLLFSLLIILTGCSRREILDDYPVSGVRIRLDWSKVTDKLPGGMRIIFYPKGGNGVKKEKYLSATGGEVKVPPGRYAVVVYNYDTETVCISGDEAYETIMAYTSDCKGLNLSEPMVWEPDLLYVANLDELDLGKSNEVYDLELSPRLVVKTYSFGIKAEGLNNVADIIGSISGMGGCHFLGSGKCGMSSVPIYFKCSRSAGEIKGCFNTFGMPTATMTRSDLPMILKLAIVKTDNSVQEVKIDITEAVINSESGGGGGGDEGENPNVNIELPPDVEIVVDDVDPGSSGGSGGIGGEVGGWGDEEEVELPLN